MNFIRLFCFFNMLKTHKYGLKRFCVVDLFDIYINFVTPEWIVFVIIFKGNSYELYF